MEEEEAAEEVKGLFVKNMKDCLSNVRHKNVLGTLKLIFK